MPVDKKLSSQARSFAKERGYDIVRYEKEWNGFAVFSVSSMFLAGSCSGYPLFVLVRDGEKPRMANYEEVCAICGMHPGYDHAVFSPGFTS